MREEAARLRQLADIEHAHAQALLERAKQGRKAAGQLDSAADTVDSLAKPSAAADYLGPEVQS